MIQVRIQAKWLGLLALRLQGRTVIGGEGVELSSTGHEGRTGHLLGALHTQAVCITAILMLFNSK